MNRRSTQRSNLETGGHESSAPHPVRRTGEHGFVLAAMSQLMKYGPRQACGNWG